MRGKLLAMVGKWFREALSTWEEEDSSTQLHANDYMKLFLYFMYNPPHPPWTDMLCQMTLSQGIGPKSPRESTRVGCQEAGLTLDERSFHLCETQFLPL